MTEQEIDNLKPGDIVKATSSISSLGWNSYVYMQYTGTALLDEIFRHNFVVLLDSSDPEVTRIFKYPTGYSLSISTHTLLKSSHTIAND